MVAPMMTVAHIAVSTSAEPKLHGAAMRITPTSRPMMVWTLLERNSMALTPSRSDGTTDAWVGSVRSRLRLARRRDHWAVVLWGRCPGVRIVPRLLWGYGVA